MKAKNGDGKYSCKIDGEEVMTQKSLLDANSQTLHVVFRCVAITKFVAQGNNKSLLTPFHKRIQSHLQMNSFFDFNDTNSNADRLALSVREYEHATNGKSKYNLIKYTFIFSEYNTKNRFNTRKHSHIEFNRFWCASKLYTVIEIN